VTAASELIVRGPTPPPHSPLGRASRFARRAVLRLMKPYAAHQRSVDEEIVQAAAGALEMARRVQHDTGSLHAEMLSNFRQLDRLITEIRSRPAQQYLPFETYQSEVVGRVYGYRDWDGRTAEGDAYRDFEDMFRGSEALIRERQRCYLALLANREPVLDVGCGRGELLDLLRDAEIACTGIDTDAGMVERCRAKGHGNVQVADANSFLESQEDGSLGAIFSAQVIEHMPASYLQRFFGLSAAKLRPDGVFIAETVNPHSVQAMKAFWLDLTHQQPIFPEVALGLCRTSGFGSAYVFHPNGSADSDIDRYTQGDYAVVATAPRAIVAPQAEEDSREWSESSASRPG
jgi:SAM-dependent methyltransferase